MKKNISKIILAIIGSFILVAPTSAGTEVYLLPSSIEVGSDKEFNISVSVDPKGIKNYVEKIEIEYPADIIRVEDFTFDDAWIPLKQSGYDMTDNANGLLVRSAGYPEGFSSDVPFGTITFSAKKEGKGTVSIGGNSMAFEIDNQSVISGLPASVVITEPAVVVLEESLFDRIFGGPDKTPSIPVGDEGSESGNEPTVNVDDSDLTASMSQTSFMATIGNILTFGTDNKAIGFMVIISIMALIYCGINFAKKKKRK